MPDGWELFIYNLSYIRLINSPLLGPLIYILKPPLWSFSGVAQYTWKQTGSDLHVAHHAVKIKLTKLDLVQVYFKLFLVREICKLGNVAPYFGEFYKLGLNL